MSLIMFGQYGTVHVKRVGCGARCNKKWVVNRMDKIFVDDHNVHCIRHIVQTITSNAVVDHNDILPVVNDFSSESQHHPSPSEVAPPSPAEPVSGEELLEAGKHRDHDIEE